MKKPLKFQFVNDLDEFIDFSTQVLGDCTSFFFDLGSGLYISPIYVYLKFLLVEQKKEKRLILLGAKGAPRNYFNSNTVLMKDSEGKWIKPYTVKDIPHDVIINSCPFSEGVISWLKEHEKESSTIKIAPPIDKSLISPKDLKKFIEEGNLLIISNSKDKDEVRPDDEYILRILKQFIETVDEGKDCLAVYALIQAIDFYGLIKEDTNK